MAITAKAYYTSGTSFPAQDSMIYGLVSHGNGTVDAITKVSAKTTDGVGLGSFSDTITWGSVASGAVAKSNTPVINVTAGTTINYIQLLGNDTAFGDYIPYISFTITAEVFTYAGSITITSCTLSISSTIGTPA